MSNLSAAEVMPVQKKKLKSDVTLDVSLGRQYDSNISVFEIEQNSFQSDIATEKAAKISYKKDVLDKTRVKVNYQYADLQFDEVLNFDQTLQLANIELTQSFAKYKLGLNANYLDAELSGQDYLRLKQYSPYVSRFIDKKFFLRANYNYQDKDYAPFFFERDAIGHGLGLDAYYFLHGVRRYLGLSYKYEDSDAFFDFHSYARNHLAIKYLQRINVFERDTRLKSSLSYETRAYQAEHPLLTGERDDKRFKFRLSWELPLTNKVYFLSEYEYGNFNSNLPVADYSQNLFKIKSGIKF